MKFCNYKIEFICAKKNKHVSLQNKSGLSLTKNIKLWDLLEKEGSAKFMKPMILTITSLLRLNLATLIIYLEEAAIKLTIWGTLNVNTKFSNILTIRISSGYLM